MVRIALIVSLTAFGCATIPVAPPPAPTAASCEALKAEEVKYLHCLVEAQQGQIKELQAGQPAPPRGTVRPAGLPVGTVLPPGYVPVQAQQIYVTTDIPSVGEGVAVTYLQNGTTIPDPTLVACAWSDSGYLEVQGSGRLGVYLDQSGGTKPGVLGIPKFCARADASLAFHNVPRNGRVRVLYAQATTNTVGGYPVYQVVYGKTYVRGQRPGFTLYTGLDGY